MLSALCLVCTLGSQIVATSDVTIVGRHRVTPNATLFDFQGVRITASLNGSEAQALMFQAGNGPANHFIVTVDGVRVGDGPLSFTTAEWPRGEASVVKVPLFSGLSAGVHEVVIEKTSEPALNTRDVAPDYVGFVGFTGASTISVPRLRSSRRRVEFLGDSITAGFCNLCDTAASAPTSFPCSSRSRFRAPHVRYDVVYERFALTNPRHGPFVELIGSACNDAGERVGLSFMETGCSRHQSRHERLSEVYDSGARVLIQCYVSRARARCQRSLQHGRRQHRPHLLLGLWADVLGLLSDGGVDHRSGGTSRRACSPSQPRG